MASPPGTQADPRAEMIKMFGFMAFMIIFFWLFAIRPQQKKAREHSDMVSKLRAGDKVVTTGGIVGTVISVKDKNVAIRSADTKLEVLKSAITEITEKSGSTSPTTS
jgi:preprotein translocase subunit YajC